MQRRSRLTLRPAAGAGRRAASGGQHQAAGYSAKEVCIIFICGCAGPANANLCT